MQEAVASWYDDSEPVACTKQPMGVASLMAPCGTRVRVCFNGCVTATVDDHGPYVEGRTFDLGTAVKEAIGFDGVASVKYHIQ